MGNGHTALTLYYVNPGLANIFPYMVMDVIGYSPNVIVCLKAVSGLTSMKQDTTRVRSQSCSIIAVNSSNCKVF